LTDLHRIFDCVERGFSLEISVVSLEFYTEISV
jgi:hypothetical protein